MLKKRVIIFCLFIVPLSSCEDPELNNLMEDYCTCISESRYDEDKRDLCLEKMEIIKNKYENDAVKLQKVIQKTDNCY